MSTSLGPAEPGVAPQRQTWPAVRRWVMVAVTLVLACATPVLGSFESHEGVLVAGLRSGVVSEVAVGAPVSAPAGDGNRSVRVTWRGRVLQRHAEVPVGSSERSSLATREELVEEWQALQPGLVVVEGESGRSGGSFGPNANGIEVPSWMALAWLVTLLGSIVRLVSGPQPHVFTKWGWFWLLWVVPVIGALNFWVTGDRPGSPAPVLPGDRDRRFGGGRGLLAAFGIAAVLVLLLFVL